MAATSAWTVRTHEAAPRSEWVARPRYAPSDFITLLWRERFLMLAVFAILFVIGAAFALTLKTTYPASSSILVRLGQEYVYEPRAGDAGRGAVPDPEQVIQSETEILGSTELKQRVIDRLGLMRIYPQLAKKFADAAAAEKRVIMGQAIRGIETNLKIQTAPDTPIVRLVFTHEDPKIAALVLNTLLEEYLIFRRTVLVEANAPAMALQREAFEGRLQEADAAYENFLTSNRIADFVAEKAALSQLQSQIEQQKYQTEAQLQDRSGRLAALQSQMSQVSPEVGLYRDVNNAASDKLVELKLQREDLLGRYRSDAQPVRDLDAQITRLEEGISAGRTTGDGARRIGVNPVFQTLQTERIQLQAEVAALRQSLSALNTQMSQLLDRRLKLAELEPRFQALSLDRDVLQANVRDFAVREEQSRAAREIAAASNDNIRIVQRATAPARGSSLKKPVLVLAFLFAGFTALCAGLLRMFLRPGLPTPASASRTLDLPVLGVAPLKAA
ncbi:GumC family protein [Phenylobacterium sp.]|uniref:GumC family protein n=1 Tax=Phenylobacterium sp. TaxID=1871053 RepID=UPI00273137B4|nr:GumC family protein [Phenylobacterium sp.]MDP2213609.1 GumC family protein [Phenylobacterium sp.]